MKIFVVALISLLLGPLFSVNVQAEFKKTKIAVLDFKLQGKGFETEDMGKIVAEWLITAFVKEGRFDVIERKLLGEVLEEQRMVEAGVVSQETAAEIGKLLGVKTIISGSVLKIKDVIEVNARIVDIASASIITAENIRSSNVISLHDLVEQMAAKIIKHFPLEGYIVQRQANDVVIDLGLQSGAKPGMLFLVYREGDIVKHPKTGDVLYVTAIKTGVIKINSVLKNISKGLIIEEDRAGAVSYGNRVKSSKNGVPVDLKGVPAEPMIAGGQTNTVDNSVKPKDAVPGRAVDDLSRQPVVGVSGIIKKGRLFVDTVPEDAVVNIINAGVKYHAGVEIVAGKYHLEVSAPGYKAKSVWCIVEKGEEMRVSVKLTSILPPQKANYSDSIGVRKYIGMLWSEDPNEERKAASYLYQYHRQDQAVVDMSHQVLKARYNIAPKKDESFVGAMAHVDAMAYLCKVLGESGQDRHRALLAEVMKEAASIKLRQYAEDNFEVLAAKSKGVVQEASGGDGRAGVSRSGEAGAGADFMAQRGRLYVDTIPKNAVVRIVNAGIKYYGGIDVLAGDYNIEVSAPGYQRESVWCRVNKREELRITVKLVPSARQEVARFAGPPELRKYIDMLWSADTAKEREAAMYLYQHHKKNLDVIDVSQKVLAVRYTTLQRDGVHVDAMAYLCNILGESGQAKFRTLLTKVKEEVDNMKLSYYANKNLSKLAK